MARLLKVRKTVVKVTAWILEPHKPVVNTTASVEVQVEALWRMGWKEG